MANPNTRGLLEELGLDKDVRTLGRQQFMQTQAPNSSQPAAFMALGQRLGRGIGRGAAPLAGGIAGMFGDGPGFKEGARQAADAVDARMTGLTPEALKAREATQAQLQDLDVPSTGDNMADREATLQQIVNVANQNGDSNTALAAMQRLTMLRAQRIDLETAEGKQREQQRQEARDIETDSSGRTLHMVGDDPDGGLSTGRLEEDGTWTVFRPNGEVLQGVDGDKLILDPDKAARLRSFEMPEGQLEKALKLNGYNPSAILKGRAEYKTFAETATIVGDMAEGMLDMYNPSVALSDSNAITRGADRAFSLVDTVSSVFTRNEDKQREQYRISYGGKPVSAKKQRELATATSHYDKFLASQGIDFRSVLPDHIKEDTEQAALFKANMMRLAYLDARLQEPSNRGLSDADIQNALERIGAASPNPNVFARQWKRNIRMLQGKSKNLGVELSQVGNVTKQALKDHLWNPELRNQVDDTLFTTSQTLDNFLGIETPTAPPIDLSGMSDEELDAEIARQQAAEQGGF